jgi:hypothetical protein
VKGDDVLFDFPVGVPLVGDGLDTGLRIVQELMNKTTNKNPMLILFKVITRYPIFIIVE